MRSRAAPGSVGVRLSHQLRLLRERGAVTRRKAGRMAFYALADEHVRPVLADALAHSAEPTSQTA